MECLSLTMPYATGGRSRPMALAAAALATVAGLVLALTLPALWPLALSAAAAIAGARLMQAQPLGQQLEYFAANEDGLRYVHTPGAQGRVVSYKWTELRAVAVELARDQARTPRLVLRTGRGAVRGATVYWTMHSDADCLAAQQAAERWLSAYRL